jgi:hypothetical protein
MHGGPNGEVAGSGGALEPTGVNGEFVVAGLSWVGETPVPTGVLDEALAAAPELAEPEFVRAEGEGEGTGPADVIG